MFCKILIVLALVEVCYCTSMGAPETACESMTPDHLPFTPSSSPTPYKAILGATKINRNESAKIIITGNDLFKGFLIEIRNKCGIAVGNFDVSESDGEAQTLDCFGLKNNAATQSDFKAKTSVNLRWVSPDEPGIYKVYLSMVKKYDTFWVTETNTTVTVI